jgi:hypothetical protein
MGKIRLYSCYKEKSMKICLPVEENKDTPLSPEMVALLKTYFWADFSDVFPHLSWDEKKPAN